MKTKILCLFFAFTFLFIIMGTLFASAEVILDHWVETDVNDLNLLADNFPVTVVNRSYMSNDLNPEYGDIASLLVHTSEGSTYQLQIEVDFLYTVRAGTRVSLSFMVLAPTQLWNRVPDFSAFLVNRVGYPHYTVYQSDKYDAGYSGVSPLISYGNGYNSVRYVSFLIDNSKSDNDLIFDALSLDFFCDSLVFLAGYQIGMSSVFVDVLEDSHLAPVYPEVDTSDMDELEDNERELLDGITNGRDIGNNILSGMSGNVMRYSSTLAAISAFMADIVGVHGSVSMLVQMSAAIGIACVIIGAGFSAVNRFLNKHDASVRENRSRRNRVLNKHDASVRANRRRGKHA